MSPLSNPDAPERTAPLLVLAAEFLRAGRPADAIAPLREAALLDPSNPTIQHDLGLACLEVGRVPDAIAALQQAVVSDPRHADAYFRLGIALEKMGDARGAIAAQVKVPANNSFITCFPNSPPAAYGNPCGSFSSEHLLSGRPCGLK